MKFGPTAQGLAFLGVFCVLSVSNPVVRKGIQITFDDLHAMASGEQSYFPDPARDELGSDYASIMSQINDIDARLERMETRRRAAATLGDAVYQQTLDETCTVNGHAATATTPEADRRMCKTVAEGFRGVASRDGRMVFYRVTQDGLAIDLKPFVVESDDHYFDIDAVKKAFRV